MMDEDNDRTKLLAGYPSAPSGPSYQNYQDAAPPYDQINNNPYPAVPATGFQPTYQTIPFIQTQVILVGGCPACRVGVLEDDYNCCGICCAILFFPLGILCCLATKSRRCTNCGAVYG